MPIDLDPRARDQVHAILREHVPDCEVWAFGSRVAGGAKRFSDLDLVIVSPVRLPVRRLALLANAFDESDLPIKVDVAEWQTMPEPMRQRIAERHELIHEPQPPPARPT